MKLFEALTQKIDKIVLVFALVVLSVSLYLVHSLSRDYTQKETISSLDTMLTFARNMLDEEQRHALSLSLLLSQDRELLGAYRSGNRRRAFDVIAAKIERLERLQGYRFEVQVHDRDLQTYLRSWDFVIHGVPLASFREGLVRVKQTLKPLVSIEVGKRLNIKAISPILEEGRFEGSIEVIEDFGHLRKRLEEQGYRLYILLDTQYLPIATTLVHAPRVGSHYVLVGSGGDDDGFVSLKERPLVGLGSFGYFTREGHLFGYFDLRNYRNDRLGYVLIAPVHSISFHQVAQHATPSTESNGTGVMIR